MHLLYTWSFQGQLHCGEGDAKDTAGPPNGSHGPLPAPSVKGSMIPQPWLLPSHFPQTTVLCPHIPKTLAHSNTFHSLPRAAWIPVSVLGHPTPKTRGAHPSHAPALFPASFQLQRLRETSGLSAPRTFPAGGGSLVLQRRKSSRDPETTKPKQPLPSEKGLRLAAPPITPASGSSWGCSPGCRARTVSGQSRASRFRAVLTLCVQELLGAAREDTRTTFPLPLGPCALFLDTKDAAQ